MDLYSWCVKGTVAVVKCSGVARAWADQSMLEARVVKCVRVGTHAHTDSGSGCVHVLTCMGHY